MSWIGWVAIVLAGLVGLDVLFVSTLITISWVKEWMRRRNL
jgi:hypothetical protein